MSEDLKKNTAIALGQLANIENMLDSSQEALMAAYKYIQCDSDALSTVDAAGVVKVALLEIMGKECFEQWRPNSDNF